MTSVVEAAVNYLQLPPGGAFRPELTAIDVRCFVVPHANGVVLIDAGPPANGPTIEAALSRVGASWSDVTDVVLTHSHFDHVGSLADVIALAHNATLGAGANDAEEIGRGAQTAVRPLDDGDKVGDLTVLATPGHTPGHISLLLEAASLVLIGDLVGSIEGVVAFGPPQFTADPVLNDRSLARVVGLNADRILFSHGDEVSDPNAAIRELLTEGGR